MNRGCIKRFFFFWEETINVPKEVEIQFESGDVYVHLVLKKCSNSSYNREVFSIMAYSIGKSLRSTCKVHSKLSATNQIHPRSERKFSNQLDRYSTPETVKANVKNVIGWKGGAERGFMAAYPDCIHCLMEDTHPELVAWNTQVKIYYFCTSPLSPQ